MKRMVLTNKSVSDLSHVSTSKQIINDPTSLCVQKVHNVFDRRTMSCNDIGHFALCLLT